MAYLFCVVLPGPLLAVWGGTCWQRAGGHLPGAPRALNGSAHSQLTEAVEQGSVHRVTPHCVAVSPGGAEHAAERG